MTQLCTLLNADADVQAICSYIPLKESTIKEWIDKQGQLIAEAGTATANKAAAQGGEAVHGGPSKVQIDWMEAFERYKKVTETVDSVGKESSKGKLQVKTSTAAEAMFASVSKMCGNAHRETAIHKVIARREGQSSPSPASVSSPSPHGLSSESSQSSYIYYNSSFLICCHELDEMFFPEAKSLNEVLILELSFEVRKYQMLSAVPRTN